MHHWFRRIDGQTSGPFTLDELKFLAARGKLAADDAVCQDGTGSWTVAATIDGLFDNVTDSPRRDTPRMGSVAETGLAVAAEVPRPRPASNASPQTMPPPSPSPTLRRDRRQQLAIIASLVSGIASLILLLLLLLWSLGRSTPASPAKSGVAGVGFPQDKPGGNALDSGGTSDEMPGDPAATSNEAGRSDSHMTPSRAQESKQTPEPADAGRALAEQASAEAAADSTDGEAAAAAQPAGQPETNRPVLSFPKLVDDADKQPEQPQPKQDAAAKPRIPQLAAASSGGKSRLPSMFRGRSQSQRERLVHRAGGTKESEAAVELGLKWLARHQAPDGRWQLDQFHQAGDCNNQCRNPGMNSDVAGTGLALLPFLGAGYTPKSGQYKTVVARGLEWMIDDQNPDGSFNGIGGGSMYAHGQAAIVLCEALALTRDRKLREPARRAVDYIVRAQHAAGGWRYGFRVPGDTSVLGWQIMALRSAQVAEISVPQETLDRAVRYLDSAQADQDGGLYAYLPTRTRRGRGYSRTMTAEGLLCRQYTGWPKHHPGLDVGTEYLLKNLPDRNSPDAYYWYYGTQVLHHMGGKAWNAWNDAMRPLLIDTQIKQGHEAGSWAPAGGHDSSGGRLYVTSLAICTLEVYYRHQPLYKD